MEVLIHWKDLPDFEDSWEPFEVIQQQFPSFNLEDKVQLWAAANVKPPIQITYVRRGKQEARSKQRGQQGEWRWKEELVMPSCYNLLFLFSNISSGSVVCGGEVFFFSY